MFDLRLSPVLQLEHKKQEAESHAGRIWQCPPRRGYRQSRKIQMKMVMTEGEEKEASEENRSREARSRKRRQFEQDRVSVGAFSSGESDCEEPSKK